jgi:hypothetical protein
MAICLTGCYWNERPDAPECAAARWTVKISRGKPTADGTPQTDIANPVFGYKSHISMDRRHSIIRRGKVTDAAAHDGARAVRGADRPEQHGLRRLG